MTRVLENRCRPLFQKLLLVVPLNDDDKARDSQPRSLLVAQFTTFLHKILRSPIEVASTAQIDRSNYRTRDSSARMRLRAHTRFRPRTHVFARAHDLKNVGHARVYHVFSRAPRVVVPRRAQSHAVYTLHTREHATVVSTGRRLTER